MTVEWERRCERLLRAYPRSYRNHRGAEMVTTLLDMAEAGRRPSRGLAVHLVLCGLRERFRPPARQPLVWAGALLAAVLLGGFGAAAGTWAGWQTAASVPSDSELRALNAALTGMPAPAAVYREASAMKTPNALVRADGTSDYSAERVRAALVADGWRITSFEERTGYVLGNFTDDIEKAERIPMKSVSYTATRGGLKLQGDGDAIVNGDVMYGTEVWPRETAAVRPLTVAGVVAGVVAGWLLAVAFAFRMRDSGRRRGWAARAMSAVALAAAIVPGYSLYRDAYQVMLYAHGSPYPYIVYSPSDVIALQPWTAVSLAALAAAVIAVAWPRREPAASVIEGIALPDRG
ncbi:hypothetical protein [Actinoplanes sp. NPDC026619]|uniref:hypothetical protein n=1 Tax=Actinoplanes sp. NPDC026619 TaxID=3155798 RepID=UPI0033D55A0B